MKCLKQIANKSNCYFIEVLKSRAANCLPGYNNNEMAHFGSRLAEGSPLCTSEVKCSHLKRT